MSINALLDEFKVKAATPKQQLAEYKAQGKKVIGVLPYYMSEIPVSSPESDAMSKDMKKRGFKFFGSSYG